MDWYIHSKVVIALAAAKASYNKTGEFMGDRPIIY
jgi:hypothetical protein